MLQKYMLKYIAVGLHGATSNIKAVKRQNNNKITRVTCLVSNNNHRHHHLKKEKSLKH